MNRDWTNGRDSGLGPEGREFKSLHSDHPSHNYPHNNADCSRFVSPKTCAKTNRAGAVLATPSPALTTLEPFREVGMAELSPITVARFWSKVSIPHASAECWEWTGALAGSGYGSFHVREMGGRPVSAHRIAYGLTKGRWPTGQELVRHKCDNRWCVNPDHLETGNYVDNARDMMERARHKKPESVGEKNGNAKLSADNVATIRQLIEAGKNNTVIARQFGVTHSLISRIRRGRSWAA